MLKADNRTQTRNENYEEMRRQTTKLAAISNLEKRLKSKGNKSAAFENSKQETRKKIEQLRRS